MKLRSVFTVAACVIFLSGCSGNVGMGGKVTFSDDGSPLTTGTVCFTTDTFLAQGTIQPDGTYTVGSESIKDGIPPGKYRVYITGAQKEVGQSEGQKLADGHVDSGNPVYEPLIDLKYGTAATSGIEVEVMSSQKNYDIVVDRYDPNAK